MSEIVYRGTRPTGLRKPSRRWPDGRVCEEKRCRTRLSVYNRAGRCGVHEDVELGRTIGRIVGTKR